MQLADIHCHLQDDSLFGQMPAILRRAGDAGVELLACCGTQPGDWPRVQALAQQDPRIVPFFGLHPLYAAERPADWLQQLKHGLQAMPAGVGEIGLDGTLPPELADMQQEVFVEQLNLARQLRLPVNLHCRRAWDKMPGLLEKYPPVGAGLVVHSYSGPSEMIPRLAEHGVYFSFSGSLTRINHKRAHAACREVPLRRLLIETDAPDLLPVTGQPAGADQPNEPANLPYVLYAMAAIRQMTPLDLAEQLWQNSLDFLAPVRKGRGTAS